MASSDKVLEDELDKKSIDQLHAVTLQFGSQCFEAKKLCSTILVSSAILVATFTNKLLDPAFFVCAGFIIFAFWMLDAYSFFYQERLRTQMARIAKGMLDRRDAVPILGTKGQNSGLEAGQHGVGMPMSNRKQSDNGRVWRALFNTSMLFYLMLALLDGILALLYARGLIAGVPNKV